MYAQSQHAYQSQAVETAGPAQLVLMLYDRALVAVARARLASGPGAMETINAELQRAQDIVTELTVTLDHGQGGQVAANLASLYEFCSHRLVTANLTKQLDGLDGVESVLRQLRDGWEQACCRIPLGP